MPIAFSGNNTYSLKLESHKIENLLRNTIFLQKPDLDVSQDNEIVDESINEIQDPRMRKNKEK